ncbi:MAG TPA: DUF1287 domain-containing protein [Hyphomonadaceae bacterium]|nr:DUF1287 domain-containing protein [Hyphomonadaceae bacterium]
MAAAITQPTGAVDRWDMKKWDRRLVVLSLGSWGVAPCALAQQSAEEDVSFPVKVAIGAELRARKSEVYDPAYVKLAYPMGDVPDDRGVCTDTVIRAFRHAGVDLQKEVHEDMTAQFSAYPKAWGLTRPDSNIDHRRVPNLETFFRRKGASRTLSRASSDYMPGDIVSWRLFLGGAPHIGVVTRKTFRGEPLIAHNIGAGTREETCLFNWQMSGWFRFERWA